MQEEKKKLKINRLSKADSVKAQGVGSVYLEERKLLDKYGKNDFEIQVNSHKKGFDLYHIHSINPSFYFRRKKNRTTIRFVHFRPDTLEGSIRLPKLFFRIFKKYVVSFYKKAKEIVVVNPSFKEELIAYGLDQKRISYIPNFVSKDTFFPVSREEKKHIRKKYGVPEHAFVVLGVGQVQTRKGILDFIELSKRHPERYFIWAGGFSFKGITDGYPELKKERKEKRENRKFLGIIDRKKRNDIYNRADVFLLPSYNELFPMALLENCSVGNPFIVRDLSLYDCILPSSTLRAKENSGFSSLLTNLYKDKDFYEKGKLISAEIKKTYSEENIYHLWKEYYFRIYQKYNREK